MLSCNVEHSITCIYLFIKNDFFSSFRALFVCSGNANGPNTTDDIT